MGMKEFSKLSKSSATLPQLNSVCWSDPHVNFLKLVEIGEICTEDDRIPQEVQWQVPVLSSCLRPRDSAQVLEVRG